MFKISASALEKIRKPDGTIPPIHNIHQYIIWKFLKNPDSANWGNEIKISKQIKEKFPLLNLAFDIDLGFKLNSLAWFLTKDGVTLLQQKQKNLTNQHEYFSNKKIFNVENTGSNTVLDFLKNKE